MKSGTIWIIDAKSGITSEINDAKPRAETLQKYIKLQNKKGKKLKDEIAIYVNGTWRYNDKEKYNYNPEDLSDWKVVNL